MEKPFTSSASDVSCTACRSAKVKCVKDDGPTCRRCQKKGMACTPHDSKQGQHGPPKAKATKEKKKEPMSAKERKRKSRKNRSEEKDQQEKESNKARETKRRREKKEREAAEELARQQQQQQEQQQQQQDNLQPQPKRRKNRNKCRGYGPNLPVGFQPNQSAEDKDTGTKKKFVNKIVRSTNRDFRPSWWKNQIELEIEHQKCNSFRAKIVFEIL